MGLNTVGLVPPLPLLKGRGLKLGNSKEALSWIRLAEQEQNQLGRTIIPGLSDNRQKLESTMATHDHK